MKLPFSFSLKLVFRLLLPGYLVAAAALPLTHLLADALGISWNPGTVLTVTAIVFGWALVIADMPIYMAWEGRRYWPARVRRWFVRKEQARANRLLRVIDSATGGAGDPVTALVRLQAQQEASVEYRQFPMDDEGKAAAIFPTRLGNLLAAFEEYPKRVYGMDSVFYWSRVFLTLDDETREYIDSQQAVADSSLYVATGLVIGGISGVVYALLSLTGVNLHPALPPWSWLALALASTALGWVVYRVTLPVHHQFGETFKSVFDLHHEAVDVSSTVKKVAGLTDDPALVVAPAEEQRMAAWRYLHNYMVRIGGKSLRVPTVAKDGES